MNHKTPADKFSTLKFGVIIFPQVEELDFIGPWEMITLWRQIADGPTTCLIVAEHTEPVVCAKGLSINPHISFDRCPPLDFMLIPGGQGTRSEVSNQRMLDFVAQQGRSCKEILSVCTGSFILHAAGLLSGRKATTHWGSLDRLRALGDVQVIEERFTRDGNIWCSAGVSAGIDLTLRFISEIAGDEIAGKVQHTAEYYPSGATYGGLRSSTTAPGYIRNS